MKRAAIPWAAWEQLRAGNARLVSGAVIHPNRQAEVRCGLIAGQHPLAAVLSCADSRVPAELVFDQGFGDLFVIRNAGPVCGDATLGSAEFAVGVLGVPLLVVLTHHNCGAIAAARKAQGRTQALEGHLQAIADGIAPAAVTAPLDEAAGIQAEHLVQQLTFRSRVLHDAAATGTLGIVGATYSLVSSEVVETCRVGEAVTRP